ncbi:MAG: hypothetical protein ACI8PB_003485 [Desulforhopalus sp.]
MFNSTQKPWISPFVAVTYTAVAVSGILMLLHIKFPGVLHIHQWGGILFLIGGTIHMLINWRILISYFKNTKAVYGALAGILMMVLLVSLSPQENGGGRHGYGKGQLTYENNYQR